MVVSFMSVPRFSGAVSRNCCRFEDCVRKPAATRMPWGLRSGFPSVALRWRFSNRRCRSGLVGPVPRVVVRPMRTGHAIVPVSVVPVVVVVTVPVVPPREPVPVTVVVVPVVPPAVPVTPVLGLVERTMNSTPGVPVWIKLSKPVPKLVLSVVGAPRQSRRRPCRSRPGIRSGSCCW